MDKNKETYFPQEDKRNIRIHNELLNIKNITVDELFLYTHLNLNINKTGEVITNITLLSCLVPYLKTEKRNRKKIKETLISLHKKEIIHIKNFTKDIKANDLLEVSVLDAKKNYTAIPSSYIEDKTPLEFYILMQISRWSDSNNKAVAKYTYARLAEICSVSESTIYETITKMLKRKIIFTDNEAYEFDSKNGRVKSKVKQYHTDSSYFGKKVLTTKNIEKRYSKKNTKNEGIKQEKETKKERTKERLKDNTKISDDYIESQLPENLFGEAKEEPQKPTQNSSFSMLIQRELKQLS